MKMKWIALAVAAAIPAAAMAIGGASGPKIDYEVQGHIGEVMGNPYGIAPLTAVIRDGGYTLAEEYFLNSSFAWSSVSSSWL